MIHSLSYNLDNSFIIAVARKWWKSTATATVARLHCCLALTLTSPILGQVITSPILGNFTNSRFLHIYTYVGMIPSNKLRKFSKISALASAELVTGWLCSYLATTSLQHNQQPVHNSRELPHVNYHLIYKNGERVGGAFSLGHLPPVLWISVMTSAWPEVIRLQRKSQGLAFANLQIYVYM